MIVLPGAVKIALYCVVRRKISIGIAVYRTHGIVIHFVMTHSSTNDLRKQRGRNSRKTD